MENNYLAPNGQVSNLTPVQYKLVRTKAFKEWFGDWENDPENASKVVDENGEPLVVYHGSRQVDENTKFNIFKIGNGAYGEGIYFTSDKKEAFGWSLGNYVYEVFLNIKNPFIETYYRRWNESINKSNKYNGILIMDLQDISTIISFESNQIKLADGTNNTFDSNNNDIRFDGGGKVEDLISQGVVELKMFDTKPEHAKEYGLDSVNPLYVQSLCITENQRLKGIGNKVLQYIDDYAIKNGHDLVFGHITQKAEFTKDNRETFFCDTDMIKNWLHSKGYAIQTHNNDFHKVINNDIRFMGGGLIVKPNKVVWDLQSEIKDVTNELIDNATFSDYLKDELRKVRPYIVDSQRGRAYRNKWFFSVPLWAYRVSKRTKEEYEKAYEKNPKWNKDKKDSSGYFIYYVAHELAHFICYFTNKNKSDCNGHNKNFYDAFKKICPYKYQYFELSYIKGAINFEVPTYDQCLVIPAEEQTEQTEHCSIENNNVVGAVNTRIKGLQIALKLAKAENKDKIEKRIKGLEIAQKMQKFNKGGMTNKGYVSYKDKYNTKYGYKNGESHDLEEIAKDTGVSIKGLQQIYNKGIGAYKTNPQSVRPNVKSKEQWAMARVYSSVMGGKASKIDSNELKMELGGMLQGKDNWENKSIKTYLESVGFKIGINGIVTYESVEAILWLQRKYETIKDSTFIVEVGLPNEPYNTEDYGLKIAVLDNINNLSNTKKGLASFVLDKIIEGADLTQTTLQVIPKQMDNLGLTTNQLIDWYSKRGFKPINDGIVYERKASKIDSNELKMELGGLVGNTYTEIMYRVILSTETTTDIYATSTDLDDITSDYNSISPSDFDNPNSNSNTKELQSITKEYQFIGGDDFEAQDYIEDLDNTDFWTLTNEDTNDIESESVADINKATDEMINEIREFIKEEYNIGGRYAEKYMTISVDDEDGEFITDLNIRTGDHSQNTRNNDSNSFNLSFVIANLNATQNRFIPLGTEYYFDDNNDIEDIKEEIKGIIDDKIEEIMENREKFNGGGGVKLKNNQINWVKNVGEEGWSKDMAYKNAYENSGGYISTSGNWKTYRDGRFYYDKDMGGDNYKRDGDWIVMRNDKFYGEFDSLIEAKEYVENWVRINPKDYVDGGGVGKMNYADGRKFRIRVKQKKG